MLFRRFLKDRKAGVAPILALGIVPLVGVVGAAVDYSRANAARTSMQAALDSTALMVSKETQSSNLPQMATNYFTANFARPEVSALQLTVATSPISGGNSVTISAAGSVKTTFMGIVGLTTLNVSAQSAAEMISDGLGCVLSLSPTATGAMAAGGTTSVKLNGCSLYDNSNSPTALTVGGSSKIEALSVGVVGGVSGAENITTTQGVKTGLVPLVDPYIDVPNPTASGTVQSACNGQCPHDIATLNPGIYKNGMKLVAGADIILNPGTYYLQGDLSIQGGATLTGIGVTLVFMASNGTNYATADINGNATVNLTPPITGPTAGIVMFGDRGMPSSTSFKFNGGATQYLGGAIYVPTGSISFSGGVGTSTSCTQIIGNTVTFTGNSSVAINCSNYKTKPFSKTVVKLVS